MGIHGYWGAYYNIFALCQQLGIQPFTDWVASHQYSNRGLEVVAPIFRVGDGAVTMAWMMRVMMTMTMALMSCQQCLWRWKVLQRC